MVEALALCRKVYRGVWRASREIDRIEVEIEVEMMAKGVGSSERCML